MPIDTASIKTSVLGVAGYLTKSLAGYGFSNSVRKFNRFGCSVIRESPSHASNPDDIETQSQHVTPSRLGCKSRLGSFQEFRVAQESGQTCDVHGENQTVSFPTV